MIWVDFPTLYNASEQSRTPIAPERLCRIRFRNGHVTAAMPARNWRWRRFKGQAGPLPSDPVAYEEVTG